MCVYLFVYKEICYKQLVHVVTEAGKSQDLYGELVNWRANGLVPV